MKESYDKRLKSCLIVLASNVFRGRNTQVRVALIPMRKELMLMASRNNIKIRLNDDELSLLNDRVIKSGYSRERYIRSLISGIVPKEKPPLEYHKLINEFNHFEGNLSIFQPAIDITEKALGAEKTSILTFVDIIKQS